MSFARKVLHRRYAASTLPALRQIMGGSTLSECGAMTTRLGTKLFPHHFSHHSTSCRTAQSRMSPLEFKNSVTAPSPLFATFDPRPNPDSVVQGEKYRFTVIDEGCIRYEYSPDGNFEDRASTFAVHRNLPKPKFTVLRDEQGGLEIKTDRLHLQYDGKEFSASGLWCDCRAKIGQEWMHTWRYGFFPQTLGGTCRTLDGVDGRTKLEEGILSPSSITNLDDSSSMIFSPDGWVDTRGKNRVDGYLFGFGGDYRDALRIYYEISGKPPMLPRWALGNWWSRYYPYSAQGYTDLMERFKQEKVPLSVAVLDMDWHKVDIPEEYGTPWTGYTWEKKLFPDHVKFMQEMHDRDLKITLNTHPADGVRGFEEAYTAMCKALGQKADDHHPVNFDCTSREFLSAYMSTLHHPLEDEGVDFWWIDWQQGTHSRIPGIDPLWILNHYHFIDSIRRMGRPMTFSRYAGPGSGRYPIGFSGDAYVTWDTLNFQPEFTATAANIGFGWWSHDIGGHWAGIKDDELATRWVQLGCFSPILRLHSSNNPFNCREPWRHGAEAERIQSEFLRLRHRLVPYTYTESVRCATEGRALVEPIYYDYSSRNEAYKHKNQSTFGTQLIINPITTPRHKGTLMGRADTWLPEGLWVDLFTYMVYDGDRITALHRTLDHVPVLAKPGAIIPLDATKDVGNGCLVPEDLEIIIVVGANGEYELLEDDGSGAQVNEVNFSRTKITFDQSAGEITIHPSTNPLLKDRKWSVRFPAYTKTDIKASSAGSDISITVTPKQYRTIVELPSLPTSAEIIIILGANPQLDPTNDVLNRIETLLDKMQIEYNPKLDIWNACKADAKPHVRISRLEALGADVQVESAIKEIMFARA